MILAATVSAPSMADGLTDPTPFEIGYGMSFFEFDACGDTEAGRIFRRALIDKFAQCPFTQEARAAFQTWRLETLEDMTSTLAESHQRTESPRGPPDLYGPDGAPNGRTCADHRATASYQEKRATLLRYGRGEVGADAVFGAACPSGPASL